MNNIAMGKEKWIELFKLIGLDDETMVRWHNEFETRYPDDHQSFLEWLGVSDDEIADIRDSR